MNNWQIAGSIIWAVLMAIAYIPAVFTKNDHEDYSDRLKGIEEGWW